ncbi:hypothetical protein ACFQBQ_18145 [Granulicella cerasi]|uniref:Uncharacterized protein n=1 Tax=Granulicella cerasi TaxID=741063 RepID=A0ABW1ZDG8_9BACT|nr:hypothetical protein [Granulicella cerasi]
MKKILLCLALMFAFLAPVAQKADAQYYHRRYYRHHYYHRYHHRYYRHHYYHHRCYRCR